MSNKRFLGIITTIAIALGSVYCPAFAETVEPVNTAESINTTAPAKTNKNVSFSIVDIINDKVRLEITNDAMKEQQCMLYVFKPGKSVVDIKADGTDTTKDVLFYTKPFTYGKDATKCSLDFNIKKEDKNGNVYKYLFTSSNGVKEEGEFEYYANSNRDNLIKEINDAKGTTTVPKNMAERIYKYFSQQSFLLYESVADKNKIGEKAMKLIGNTEVASDNIAEFFKDAVVVTAFCDGSDGLFVNKKFAYMDYIKLEGNYLKYFENNLSEDGIKKSIENSYDKNYAALSEIKTKLEQEVIINTINYNKALGYGHIQTAIEDFKDEFVKAGLDYDKYSKSDRAKVGQEFIKLSKQTTLKGIAGEINKIVDDISYKPPKEPSGGGGGGGGKPSGPAIAPPSAVKPEEKEPIKEAIFSDLEGFEWATESIESLFKKGVITGKGEGKFSPADSITREEFTVLLVKAFNLKNDAASAAFDDVNSSRWSYQYIASAYTAGIISGDGKNFKPEEKITRQDIASILLRTIITKNAIKDVKPAKGFFDDEEQISSYALESVQIMNELGVVNGDGSGCFRPKNNANRAEAAVIIQRALDLI